MSIMCLLDEILASWPNSLYEELVLGMIVLLLNGRLPGRLCPISGSIIWSVPDLVSPLFIHLSVYMLCTTNSPQLQPGPY